MSSAVGGTNQGSLTSGNFVDVRDFGAKAEYGFDNTPAFQAAVDYVTSKGGGTVFIPGSREWPHYYWLEKPVYVNGNSVSIKGEGAHASILWTWGPAFMFTRHPRLWTNTAASYVDNDTGLTVKTLDDKNEFIFEDRFKIDLHRFTANGDIKAGLSGEPPLDASFWPNSAFAIRPRNVVKGIFPGNPLANGGLQGWESRKQLTFEFITFAHDRPIEGGVAGTGEWNKPDPWLMSGNSSEFHFCIAMTDDSLVNKAIGRLKFKQPQTKGLHRICVQLDWELKKFTVFVDRVQVDFTFEFDGGVPLSDLFTKYNSLARWEHSDFAVGSRNRTSNRNESELASHSDYSVLAAKVWPSLRYLNRTSGQAQAKIDGSAVTDNDALMFTQAGSLAGLFVWEGKGSDLLVYNHNRDRCFGMLVPLGEGPSPVANCRIADLGVEGMVFAPQSDGITLGPYLHLDIENVTIKGGFYNSIGSLDCFISYPLYMNDCRLYASGTGFFGLNQSAIHARNTTFAYVGRTAIRLAGSGSCWDGGMTNDFEHTAEAFFMGFRGKSIGAGHRIENFMIDTEGTRVSPKVAYFYLQKPNFVTDNGLFLKNISTGQSSDIPTVYLDDPDFRTWLYSPGFVSVEGCSFSHEGPILRVCGKDWQGSVDVIRSWCGDSVIQVDTSIYDDTKMKTVHRDLSAPPNLGGWYAGAHDIQVPRPPEGGVSAWDCARSGFEGSAQPPVWMPKSFRLSRQKNLLTGNIFANFYVNLTARHPKLAKDSKSRFAIFQDYPAQIILEYLLNRSGTFDKSKIMIANDPMLTNRSNNPRSGMRRSNQLDNNGNLWTIASGGSKSNKVEITMIDSSQEPWPLYTDVRQRQSGFFIITGDGTWNDRTVMGVVSGRFEPQQSDFFNNDPLTIPVGGLVLNHAVRDGSWSVLAQNRILDWIFGNAVPQFPTTFYVGLSKTPIAADGSGVNEISGGGYSRAAVTLSGNNFMQHDEYGSTWSNANTIKFANPTADWGNCEWFFLSDSASGGSIWASGPLHQPVKISAGETAPSFSRGCLQIQI